TASSDGRDEVSDSDWGAASIDTRGAVIDSDLTGRFHHVSDEGYALFMTCHPHTCTTDSSWDIRRVGQGEKHRPGDHARSLDVAVHRSRMDLRLGTPRWA